MLLVPQISQSGKTQWILHYLDHHNRNTNSAVEIRFYVSPIKQKRLAIPALAKKLEKADFDWVYVENGKVRVDASAGLDALAIRQSHVPWFKGLLEIEPIIERNEDALYVRVIVEREHIRSVMVSGGEFSLAPDTTNFRRLVTWLPLFGAIAWTTWSYVVSKPLPPAEQVFNASGAVVAVAGAWIDLWLWLWQKDVDKQPIQPKELKVSMIAGFLFIAIGSIIWAYGSNFLQF
jgi:hypothetical protein